jgi:hypothetical protein
MAADAPVTAAAQAQTLPDKHWAILNTYCEKCHNTTDWTGGVAFDSMQPAGIPADAKIWEAAVSKLRGRMMPPPGEKQPDQATIDSFVSWMEDNLDKAAAAHPDAGYVSLHRLNRVVYASAVKDLLNVDVDPAALLPQDTKSDGFDNVASVLKVSPTFLDQYISAARTVAALAVGSAHASQAIVTYRAGPHDQIFHIEGLPLGTRGGMSVLHNFPADGTYTFNLNVGTGTKSHIPDRWQAGIRTQHRRTEGLQGCGPEAAGGDQGIRGPLPRYQIAPDRRAAPAGPDLRAACRVRVG